MKTRKEQLTWAKQRALMCVDVGHFSDAVAGLRADLVDVQRPSAARVQGGGGRGARPGFASAHRVDRKLRVIGQLRGLSPSV